MAATAPPRPSRPRARMTPRALARAVGGAVIVAASLLFIVKATHFFSLDPKALGKYVGYGPFILGHIAGGMVALVTGPLQISQEFRRRYLRAHRVLGKVYVSATSLGAICALVLASTTARTLGSAYALSLHVLAAVWLTTGLVAWRTAVGKRLAQHEEWANRSYIATVAFVAQSLFFEIPAVARLGSFAELGGTVIWLSWTAPMFAYDCLRSLRQKPALA